MNEKRGLSEIIVTIILILLVLAAIIIVWFFVNNLIQKNKEVIPLKETLILQRMDIQKVEGDLVTPSLVKVIVARGATREKYEGEEVIEKKADIVFIIDSTGSMGPRITQVSNIVKSFVDKLNEKSIDARLALVEFRDYPNLNGACGQASSSFTYRVHTFSGQNFTIDSDLFKTEVTNVASGVSAAAGDFPEAHLIGINQSLMLNLDDSARKIFIVLSDSAPHAQDCTCTKNPTYSGCFTHFNGDTTDASCYLGPKTVNEVTNSLVAKDVNLYYLSSGTVSDPHFPFLCENVSMESVMTSRTGGAYYSYSSSADIQNIILNLADSISEKYSVVVQFDHINIVFYNDSASYVEKIFDLPLKSFDSKTYDVDLAGKISNVKRVEVYSVLKTKSGEEVIGPVTDVWRA